MSGNVSKQLKKNHKKDTYGESTAGKEILGISNADLK